MWNVIQILLIIVLVMGIIALGKYTYIQLGCPKIPKLHFPRRLKRPLFYFGVSIFLVCIIISVVTAGLEIYRSSSYTPYTPSVPDQYEWIDIEEP